MEIINLKHKNIIKNKIIEYTSKDTDNIIDENSRKRIIDLLLGVYTESVENPILVQFPYVALAFDIDWTADKSKGSLAKRVAKTFYENTKIPLNDKTIGIIGSIAKTTTVEGTYCFDFVDSIEWDHGDFGDAGSCLWSDRKDGRLALAYSENFMAIRFFKKIIEDEFSRARDIRIWYRELNVSKSQTSGYAGISRAWIFMKDIEHQRTDNKKFKTKIFVVFNGYGYSALLIAKIFAKHIGYSVRQILALNNKKRTGEIYINNDAYLVGPEEIIDEIIKIDFAQEIVF